MQGSGASSFTTPILCKPMCIALIPSLVALVPAWRLHQTAVQHYQHLLLSKVIGCWSQATKDARAARGTDVSAPSSVATAGAEDGARMDLGDGELVASQGSLSWYVLWWSVNATFRSGWAVAVIDGRWVVLHRSR